MNAFNNQFKFSLNWLQHTTK